jgi:hypothetical protein
VARVSGRRGVAIVMLKNEKFLDASFADYAGGRKGFDVRFFPRNLAGVELFLVWDDDALINSQKEHHGRL